MSKTHVLFLRRGFDRIDWVDRLGSGKLNPNWMPERWRWRRWQSRQNLGPHRKVPRQMTEHWQYAAIRRVVLILSFTFAHDGKGVRWCWGVREFSTAHRRYRYYWRGFKLLPNLICIGVRTENNYYVWIKVLVCIRGLAHGCMENICLIFEELDNALSRDHLEQVRQVYSQ